MIGLLFSAGESVKEAFDCESLLWEQIKAQEERNHLHECLEAHLVLPSLKFFERLRNRQIQPVADGCTES